MPSDYIHLEEISRKTVIEIGKMHKTPIKIRSVIVIGLGEADQAFLSYSGGVIPLVKVLDRILAIAALVRYLSFRSNLFGS